ncbi:hypothetical protein HYS92_01495 [Candidatus Daviesbacteria bacterium]|nr:hypothetical protein [Candidatus Daviesbacteria bacterium]
MFTNTLSKNASGALALLGKSGILNKGYLAGGTACALQIGHRISYEFSSNIVHIKRSLDYFEDAESQEINMLIPVSWEEVKKFFQTQTLKLAKDKLKI